MSNILFIIIIFLFVIEITHWFIVGFLLKDEIIKEFAKKEYRINPLKNEILMESSYSDKPMVAILRSVLSKWYIEDVGCIPRWSKYSKHFDKLRIELLINN